ncbi:MAG: M1 family aminopeptidase [Verrucomicrobiales bacterium]
MFLVSLAATQSRAQEIDYDADPFRQLEEILPTANEYRAASGAPGHAYWQQRADYAIKVRLDDENQRVEGEESVVYHNRSPLPLNYVWFQLDQNRFRPDSDDNATDDSSSFGGNLSFKNLNNLLTLPEFKGGHNITKVADGDGNPLRYSVVRTMMRVDLPAPLEPGADTTFQIQWNYNIVDAKRIRARGGFEFFKDDGNYLYEIAQWYPRVAAYTDVNGWQHKQFLGNGEFTLEFGDFEVEITAPDDHIVAATGELQNPGEVLTDEQRKRLLEAESAEAPMFIVTPEEATANESSKPTGTKTWVFKANNVRDFAWASSRKFIWDAVLHKQGGNHAWAMSYYPKEAEPLWSKYSTQSIVHTLNVYSRYTFDYPYPVAISVNGPIGGMEYPMICFNGPRPEKDGTYSERTKYGLISVVIHEVGHNYFPMIVNSDERQWTWMDEGLNTFLQFLSEQEWEDKYPSYRGQARKITGYMAGGGQRPIMTNSESILQFGNNAYAKPATALNILRETVMGRELFDFAFREYAQRWMFKRPEPADFFRSMEDASGLDLDWFWRGWFYTTKHTDQSIGQVRWFEIDTKDPDIEKPLKKKERDEREATDLTTQRNRDVPKYANAVPALKDFYNTFDELDVTPQDREAYENFMKELEGDDKELLKQKRNFYTIEIRNNGLVMPVIFDVYFADGTREQVRMPAEVWRKNHRKFSKLVVSESEIERIMLDPHEETADANMDNNYWPSRPAKSRFQLFKEKEGGGGNPMRSAKEAEEKEAKKEEGDKAADKAKEDKTEEVTSDAEPDNSTADKSEDALSKKASAEKAKRKKSREERAAKRAERREKKKDAAEKAETAKDAD